MNSNSLISRAEQRRGKIGSGSFETADALMAEIALSQLDATLAVATAIQEQGKDRSDKIDELEAKFRWLGRDLQTLQNDVRWFRQDTNELRRQTHTHNTRKKRKPWWHKFVPDL